MKKIFCLLILIIIVYTIYYFNHTEKINYISIGDSLSLGMDANGNTNYGYSKYIANYLKDKNMLKKYNNTFSSSGTRITDLLNDIKINKTITKNNQSLSIKKCLRESNLVTLSIGTDDILSKITFSTNTVETLTNENIIEIANSNLKSLDSLLNEIRKYAKGNIILIGYYNTIDNNSIIIERLYSYLITKTKKITAKYDIEYLDIYNTFKKNKDYLPNPTNFYPSTRAYEDIANKIIEKYLPNQ